MVKFKTPASVPANLRVVGKKTAVLSKPDIGRTAQLVLPPGRYKLAADPATLNGRSYEPRLAVSQVKVAKGKTTKITLRMKRVRLATDLGVTNLTPTTADLVWRAPRGAKVKLRRTPGDTLATKPAAGTGVKLTKKNFKSRKVTVTSLAAGGYYTYTLFSQVGRNRWHDSPGLTIHTPATLTPAAYVIKPGAIVVEPGDPDKVTVRGDGTVVLDPASSRPDPALGAAIILPISQQLPAGLVGKIITINPDGTLVLGEGDIPSAFDYLDLNYDLDQLPTQRITAEDLTRTTTQAGTPTGSTSRSVPKFGCEFSSGLDADIIDLALSYKPGGYARHHIDYSPFHRPAGVSFDIAHTSTLTGTLEVSTGASCGISVGDSVNFMAGPIPFLLKANIYGNVSAKAAQITTVDVTAGGWAKGQLARGKITITGDKIFKTSSTLTKEGEIAFEVGTDITFGPGVASKGDIAGAVAGVNANLSLFKLSHTTNTPGCSTTDQTSGITFGVKASIWLGPLAATTYANIIDQQFSHPGYPRRTTGCITTPTPTTAPSPTPTPTTTAEKWSSVAAGGDGTCGIKTDRTAWCWGSSGGKWEEDSWDHLSTSGAHSCGIRADDSAWCWGGNAFGQLGDGTSTDRNAPTQVAGGGAWQMTDPAEGHTCGIRVDGSAWCWGGNAFGQLGDGTSTDRNAPTQVAGGGSWTEIATGYSHTCGIKTDGSAWCWGENSARLGDGSTSEAQVPSAVAGNDRWSSIATGYIHSCGIKSDGSAWCWGYNEYGAIGDDTVASVRATPVRVLGNGTWAILAAGFNHTCGIKTDGSAWCWGLNGPTQVQTGSGTIYGYWGDAAGQLGDGTSQTSLSPVAVVGGAIWTALTSGAHHTCAIRADQSSWCWGYNKYGSLGASTSATSELSPVPVTAGVS